MNKSFYESSDTYRRLSDLNQKEVLSDLCDSLSGKGMVSVAIEDLLALEDKARANNREIEYQTVEADDLSKCPGSLSEMIMSSGGTDGFILISGELNDNKENRSVDMISDVTKGKNINIMYSLINRPEQDKYRITYFSF